jgi:hypothetical protein
MQGTATNSNKSFRGVEDRVGGVVGGVVVVVPLGARMGLR